MSISVLDVVQIKNCIPEFITKIYSILERNEFEDIICWSQNDCEILIKDQKKLQKTVLPAFFRHNKIESFVRQLNMYRFSKVNKIEKERNHLYFKNEHFKKGNIESLVFIKRKKKGGSNGQLSSDDEVSSTMEAESIDNYKEFVKGNILTIQDELVRIKKNYPCVAFEFTRIFQISNMLIGRDLNCQVKIEDQQPPATSNQFFHSIKDIFPQQPQLPKFGSSCSIEENMFADL